MRLGISYVRGIGDDLAEEIAAGRPYADPEDLARRVSLTLPQLEALATSGAFDCFGMSRREAIWAAGAVAQMGTDRHGAQRLPGIVTGATAPALPAMAGEEQAPRRPVVHRREPRGPPDPVHPGAPRRHGAW